MALELKDCIYCGRRHVMMCPRIREMEWDDRLQLRRVVFWDLGTDEFANFGMMLKTYWEVEADGRSKGETGAGGGVAAGNDQHPRNGG